MRYLRCSIRFVGKIRLALWKRLFYGGSMDDLFTSVEGPVEVDEETLALIDEGIQAAEQGRVTAAEDVPALLSQWISNLSTPSRR